MQISFGVPERVEKKQIYLSVEIISGSELMLLYPFVEVQSVYVIDESNILNKSSDYSMLLFHDCWGRCRPYHIYDILPYHVIWTCTEYYYQQVLVEFVF